MFNFIFSFLDPEGYQYEDYIYQCRNTLLYGTLRKYNNESIEYLNKACECCSDNLISRIRYDKNNEPSFDVPRIPDSKTLYMYKLSIKHGEDFMKNFLGIFKRTIDLIQIIPPENEKWDLFITRGIESSFYLNRKILDDCSCNFENLETFFKDIDEDNIEKIMEDYNVKEDGTSDLCFCFIKVGTTYVLTLSNT